MHEDDGLRGVLGPDLLDVQPDAVGRGDGAGAVGGEPEEGLARVRVGAQPDPADGVPLGRQPGRRAQRDDAGDGAQADRRGPAAHAYVRGTRAPTRVTTS